MDCSVRRRKGLMPYEAGVLLGWSVPYPDGSETFRKTSIWIDEIIDLANQSW
jgi:hypothetical protein